MNLKKLVIASKFTTNLQGKFGKGEKKMTLNFDVLNLLEKNKDEKDEVFLTKVELELLEQNPYHYIEKLFFEARKNQCRDIHSLAIFNNISSAVFVKIKKSFSSLPNKEADVYQFTSLIYEALSESTALLEKHEGLVRRIIETFFLIDSHKRATLTFTQFSNFVIDFQADNDDVKGVISDKVRLKLNDNVVDSSPHSCEVEKMIILPDLEELGVIDQQMKLLRIYDVNTLKEKRSFSLPNCTITSATAFSFKNSNYVLLCTHDRYMNFLDHKSKRVISRFQVPEVQNHVMFVPEKGLVYSACTTSGIVYVWSPGDIFSPEFLDAIRNVKENYRMVLKEAMKDQQKDLTCFLWVSYLKEFITGSNDGLIRLYENKGLILPNPRILKGHKKGIRFVDYSPKYNQFASCSFDFDVILWNPFSLTVTMRFQEHDVPLLSVHYFDEMQCVISCDTKGIIKVIFKQYERECRYYISKFKDL